MTQAGIISSRKLAAELVALIDFLADPLSQVREPLKWTEAYRDLHHLVTNDSIWDSIWAIGEGYKTNAVLHALGARRTEWLKEFKESIP